MRPFLYMKQVFQPAQAIQEEKADLIASIIAQRAGKRIRETYTNRRIRKALRCGGDAK